MLTGVYIIMHIKTLTLQTHSSMVKHLCGGVGDWKPRTGEGDRDLYLLIGYSSGLRWKPSSEAKDPRLEACFTTSASSSPTFRTRKD